MKETFADLVDTIRDLPLNDKLEIKIVLEKSIIDEKRDKIYSNYLKSKKEDREKKLKFTSDIATLKKLVSDD
jgi:hypothetical protein